MALDGKKQTSMPSDIRRDMQMREFFQQGWEQASEEILLANQLRNQPDWRNRAIWFVLMVLGGLATAAHIINRVETEQHEKAMQQSTEQSQPLANIPAESLAILNEQQRRDLNLIKSQVIEQPLPLQPIIDSKIAVHNITLSQTVEQRQPINRLKSPIPKYIREIYCYTEIANAKGQTLYHRWRTDTQILATIPLEIGSDNYRTWSSKKMASGWQGQWYVEILDSQQNVIERTEFIYGLTTEKQP